MHYSETVASQCRYGHVAARIWGDWEILWEDSEDSYSGHAYILAKQGERYAYYEWSYGSCNGCDSWESDGKDDDQIAAEMRSSALWLDSQRQLKIWLEGLEAALPNERWDIQQLRGKINAVRAELEMQPLDAGQ
jgi:hypothetical protein